MNFMAVASFIFTVRHIGELCASHRVVVPAADLLERFECSFTYFEPWCFFPLLPGFCGGFEGQHICEENRLD